MDGKLRTLAVVVLVLTIALFYCEHMFPNDGQMFQAIYGMLMMFATIFGSALKKELGVEDSQPQPTTTLKVTDSHVVQQGSKPVVVPVDASGISHHD